MYRAASLVIILCVSGCGSKSERTVTADGVTLRIPDSVDPATVKLSVQRQLPDELSRYASVIDAHFTLAQVVRIEPAGKVLPSSATLIAPAGCPDKAIAVALAKDAAPETVSTRNEGGSVAIAVSKLGAFAILCPKAELIGSPRQVLRGTPELLVRVDCADHISPGSPAVKGIAADSAKFAVAPDGTITLQPKLEVRPLDEDKELAKADETIARGGGDEVSLGVVYASLFAAKGDPVELVGGGATDGARRGVTMWTIVSHEGQPMVVDVKQSKLVPLADATAKLKLEPHRGCMWFPPGATKDASVFSEPAVTPPAPTPAPSPPTLALTPTPPPAATDLLARHKQLDKQCNHGADKAACMERGKLDDQLRQELDALLHQHKDLDTKCKANRIAEACTQRDAVTERGKAIKEALAAKP